MVLASLGSVYGMSPMGGPAVGSGGLGGLGGLGGGFGGLGVVGLVWSVVGLVGPALALVLGVGSFALALRLGPRALVLGIIC